MTLIAITAHNTRWITHPVACCSPHSKTGAGAVQEVAEWRIRVHHARKRALLVVLVCVRLRQGLKRPTRLRRMESFSYMIPLALGEGETGSSRQPGSKGSGWLGCTAAVLSCSAPG